MDRLDALYLAERLDVQVALGGGDLEELEQAAAELRRLHAQNKALLGALKRVKETGVFVGAIAQEMMDAAIKAVEEGK